MIIVCSKHVKDALRMIDLPHIHSISDQNCKCTICGALAKYKLYNFLPHLNVTKKVI
jgi:hypothetical protein